MRRMYSENQIAKVVNDKIAEGVIQAGGTKLYIHKLVNNDDFGVAVISTDNEIITEVNKTEKYKKVIMLYGSSGDGITWNRFLVNDLNLFGFDSGGNLIFKAFANESIKSDTVEDL